MLLHAPAKINLFLEITGRRDDGYHNLLTLSAFTEFGDEIEISDSDKSHFEVGGEFAAEVPAEDNLILKALDLCGGDKHYRITLRKNIPVSSGLGGGSSDAAAIIRHFVSDEDKAQKICSALGADVFMCYLGKPALLGGIGDKLLQFEKLSPSQLKSWDEYGSAATREARGSGGVSPRRDKNIPKFSNDLGISPYYAVLANPRIPLATAEVFKQYANPAPRAPHPERRNDLTETAIKIVPEIGVLLEALANTGAFMSRMSGSGATCFALFEDEPAAKKCEHDLQIKFPHYWIQRTRLK